MLRSLEVPDEPSLARALELELAGRFPPGSRIIGWRRGADFFAFRVVPRGGATEWVLRVPLREVTTSVDDGTVDFGGVVEREALVHGLLRRHGIPVAPLLGWGRAAGADDHSWMMFERVDHDDRTRLSPPALAALGRVLRRIHAIAGTPDLEAAIGRETAPEAMLERVRTRVSALAERVGYLASDELLSRAQAVIGERADLRDLRLTHMDLRPEIADQLLKGDTTAVREAVRALLPETIDRASRTGWRLTFLKTDEAAYSPGLSAAVRPVLSRDRWNPGQGRRRQPELHTRLGPQHVPQHLPEEWLPRHFGASATAVPMTALQRATTIRLVQMLAGGSKEEAARYLGFPKPARHRRTLAELPATAGLAPARRADDRFDEFVRAIAAELRDGKLINYRARRTALSSWELDEETWQHLAAEARARTETRYLARGPHDRVDRLAASVAIWQRATHGHYRYAPLLKTAPGDWFRRGDRVTWKIMLGRGSSPVGIELHRLLSDYADQLGTRIDAC